MPRLLKGEAIKRPGDFSSLQAQLLPQPQHALWIGDLKPPSRRPGGPVHHLQQVIALGDMTRTRPGTR